LSSVFEGVIATAGAKSFMQEVSRYADKVFPQNEKEIDTTLEFIKNSAVSALQKTGIPKALTSKIKVQIEQQSAVAKDVLKQNLDPSIGIFDKIKIQQNDANLMLECLNQVTKTVKAHISDPKDIEVITAVVADVLIKGIKERVQGNIETIATQVRDPQVKKFAKKLLEQATQICWILQKE
jgi:GTPase